MSDDQARTLIAGLIKVLQGHDALFSDTAEALTIIRRRLTAHAGTLDDVTAELMELSKTARLLINMKAATLIVTCTKCGAQFCQEPGPQLCGKCWIAAGRPDGELRSV